MSIYRWPWSWWDWARPRAWKYRWQQLTRGYDDSDVWDMFTYLSRRILPMLRKFRAGHKRAYVDELGWDGWNEILDKMIFAFEEITLTDGRPGWRFGEDCDVFDQQVYDATKEGLGLFGKYFLDLWD